jgi:tetratricopeptide (TPR) repeat protein
MVAHRLNARGPPRHGRRLAHALLLGALAGVLLGAPRSVAGQSPTPPDPPAPPFVVAVLPFEDARRPDRTHWLGRYLRERVALALVREPQVAVLPLDVGTQWQRTLALPFAEPLTPEALRRMGAEVALRGTLHEVLGLVELRLRIETARGDLLDDAQRRLRLHLREERPAQALERVLGIVQGALLPALPHGRLAEPRPAEGWADVEALYTLLGDTPVPGDRAARPALVSRLQPWVADPALGGRAHEALAQRLLEHAQLYLPDGAGRTLMQREALRHAAAALEADPLDTGRQTLKAQLHYFLRMDYEAKTEASIARLRNPAESLAYVVLALVAGLSTGEANEQLGRALALHPFLRTSDRPRGSAPYQGGILEPHLQQWDALRTGRGPGSGPDDYAALLRAGAAHFERREWEDAERLLRQAAEQSEGEYAPSLYLLRILIELGQPGQAVAGLRRLAAENPQEPDVLFHLGVALEESGEPEPAQDAYRRALAERPDDLASLYRLATTELALGRLAQAMAGLRRVLHVNPEHAGAWLQLGRAHLHEEDWPAAEQALRRALELEPGSAEAQRLLSEVRSRLGR